MATDKTKPVIPEQLRLATRARVVLAMLTYLESKASWGKGIEGRLVWDLLASVGSSEAALDPHGGDRSICAAAEFEIALVAEAVFRTGAAPSREEVLAAVNAATDCALEAALACGDRTRGL